MILSYHPMIEKDQNRLCAGRQPNNGDLRAIQAADAVILPQGCYQSLYDIAKAHCPNVFPNYDARFQFPGKIGQALLFREFGTLHPTTQIYHSVADYHRQIKSLPLQFPVVFKFDWGGEGESVFLINSSDSLAEMLAKAEKFEHSGQSGFVLQSYIPTAGRSLRVVVIGSLRRAYWRIASDPNVFLSGVSQGARIETDLDPKLQGFGVAAVSQFCTKTKIDLAGFDILFAHDRSNGFFNTPLFLEINYFFGRQGIGGSAAYYRLLTAAVENWLSGLGLG